MLTESIDHLIQALRKKLDAEKAPGYCYKPPLRLWDGVWYCGLMPNEGRGKTMPEAYRRWLLKKALT